MRVTLDDVAWHRLASNYNILYCMIDIILYLDIIPIYLFFKDFIYLFLERGREGEREREKQYVVASRSPPTGNLACNPGMFPDRKSNQQPFGPQAGNQSTEPHQPGL